MGAPSEDPSAGNAGGGEGRPASTGALGPLRRPGAFLHLLAALLLVLMAVSHGLGTGDAAARIQASGLEPRLARALVVLWVNGSILPLVLAVVLLVAAFGPWPRRTLVGLVATVLLLQAGGAALIAGPGFFGVWVLALAAVMVAVGAAWPERAGSGGGAA